MDAALWALQLCRFAVNGHCQVFPIWIALDEATQMIERPADRRFVAIAGEFALGEPTTFPIHYSPLPFRGQRQE
jgi:hypothetical protein